ncbi:MAG: invasion associated locus B family protein [Erythrobacter sp.]|uniref:invasion associated locus B family protein n=1 Tax=Erythrobacter sp. TaxID=1042 RepID=UPI0032986B54
MIRRALALLTLMAIAAPVTARDSLGVYSNWAAFRDDSPSRCYAIAKPRSGAAGPFASVATWPDKGLRGQVYFKLSRETGENANAVLTIGEQEFELVAQGRNAWAANRTIDAGIIAAMRSASRMTVAARQSNGARFSDSYSLSGSATAMDASVVGCANRG